MRTVFLAIFATLAVLTLVAEANKPPAPPPGRIVLTWVTDNNPARQEQMRLFRAFCRRKGHRNIDIQLDPNNAGMDKVVVQSVGGVGPDLFDVRGRSEAVSYADAGICRDLTDAARRGGYSLDRMWPALRGAIRVDGRQYSQPTNGTPTCLFYNKDLFDRYGVPYPKGDWTWEQFVDTAKKLTRRRADGRGYETFGVMGYSLEECIWQAGGGIYSPDGLRCTLDSPEALEGARFFADMQHKYHVMPSSAEENALSSAGGWGQGAMNYFMGGHLAMIDIGRWAIIQWRQVPGFRYGVAPMPHHRRKACYLQWRATAVNRNSPHADAALLFEEFLTTPEYCRQINESGDSLAALPEYVNTPAFLHDQSHPEDTDNATWIREMTCAHDTEVTPYASPAVTTRLYDDQVELIRSGARAPEDAMREAARRINTAIRRNIERDPVIRQRYLTRKLTKPEAKP